MNTTNNPKRCRARILVDPDGSLRFIHSDDVAAALRGIGTQRTVRASHVEPTEDGKWQADMAPMGGPLLLPTETRAESLAAEVDWLNKHNLRREGEQ